MAFFGLTTPLLTLLALALLPLQLTSRMITYSTSQPSTKTNTTPYIIHTNSLVRPSPFATQNQWYSSIIHSLSRTSNPSFLQRNTTRIFYTYNTVLHGFAAMMTPQEAEKVSRIPGVIGVYNDTMLQLLTTRSPDLLGLNTDFGLWPESKFGENVTIGLVDTGIWPESQSFDDTGLPPVDSKWLGECANATTFNSILCNNKLIGARLFTAGQQAMGLTEDETGEFNSPRDALGHGTLTASIAAGSPVPYANLFGFASGTARGMATRARVAMYKACTKFGCLGSDILAAIEKAIEDRIDILSLSLGPSNGEPSYDNSPISIGTFGAVRRGIFVACAAGNDGPIPSTVSNSAPWIMTVGAGSIDRKFPARVTLGNGQVYVGESLYTERANGSRMHPLFYPPSCASFNLVPDLIMGKIVVCDEFQPVFIGLMVQKAGGSGLIAVNSNSSGEGIFVQPFTLPALTVGYLAGQKILSYVNSTKNPVASLAFGLETIVGESRAPTVASFSSRGPNIITPEILKPDILAPGKDILASWSPEASLTFLPDDPRRASFNILRGTSASCPHVAGIAALLRAAHPTWSPAMIRSALMTTAVNLDNQYHPIILDESLDPATPLAIGAGHIYPILARDPGLVYDADGQDYVDLLCTLNYTDEQIRKFVTEPYACSKIEGGAAGFNYPSFVVMFNASTGLRLLKRTLTKVSELPETYQARVVNPRPDMLQISVEPETLEFERVNERRTYAVEFRNKVAGPTDGMEYGYIIWENKEHQVKSPVVFMWN